MKAWEKLAEGLSQNEIVVAGGCFHQKPNIFTAAFQKPAILVRSREQDFRLLVKGEHVAITIRGLIQSPYVIQGRTVDITYVQFPTDTGVAYFIPVELYPGSPGRKKLRGYNYFEKFMEFMKGVGGLQQVELCPFCGGIRPVEIVECSNPECAPKEETEEFAGTIQTIIIVFGVVLGIVLLAAPGLRSALIEMSPFLAREVQGKYGVFSLPILASATCYILSYFISILYRLIRRISTG